MPRPVLLLTCVLALVTGSALVAMGAAIRQPDVSGDPAAGGEQIDLVRSFYEAANEVLATGEPTVLDRIVAPDLVEHPDRLGGDGGRAGLVRALLSRRAAFPGLRFVVEEVRPTGGDLVTARVRTEGVTDGAFVGLPIPVSAAAWGPLDLFRIADGVIVEHWGSRGDPLLAMPPGEAPLGVESAASPRRLVVSRLRLAPGGEVDVGWILATEVILVEAGTVDAAGERDAARSLAAGGFIVLPAKAHTILRNDGSDPAVVVTIGLWPLMVSPEAVGGSSGGGRPPDGRASTGTPVASIDSRILLYGDLAGLPAMARVAVGRLVLGPGAVVPIPAGERLLVVVVEEGRLEIVTSSGGAAVQTSLAAGGVTVVKDGAGSTLRSAEDGPTTLLLFTLSSSAVGRVDRRV